MKAWINESMGSPSRRHGNTREISYSWPGTGDDGNGQLEFLESTSGEKGEVRFHGNGGT